MKSPALSSDATEWKGRISSRRFLIGEFVQKNGPVVGQFKKNFLSGFHGPGKGTAGVAKEFAFHFLGLPWHPCREKDVRKLTPGRPVELVIDRKPVVQAIKKGHRLRLAVTASRSEYLFYREDPAPEVTVYHDARYQSYLYLPTQPNSKL